MWFCAALSFLCQGGRVEGVNGFPVVTYGMIFHCCALYLGLGGGRVTGMQVITVLAGSGSVCMGKLKLMMVHFTLPRKLSSG